MAEPQIAAQILRHVADCLEITGHSPEPLLARHGLVREDLRSSDGFVPLRHYLRFFEDAAVLSRNLHFGLHVGQLIRSDSLGPLSFLFLCAPTLGAAFDGFTRYLGTIQQAARNSFRRAAGLGIFDYGITDETLGTRRQDAEYSIGAIFNLIRQYLGADFCPFEVCFEHSRSGEYARYRSYFGCDVFFEQPSNCISFDAGLLDRHSALLGDSLFPIIEAHLRERHDRQSARYSTREQVCAAIERAPIDNLPGLAEVAHTLGMSPPTLGRRLRAEHTSFGALVIARRMSAASRLLGEGQRSVADVALAVGYAESASFIRRFRRHFGTTPRRFGAASGELSATI